jgi:hypothetical protein
MPSLTSAIPTFALYAFDHGLYLHCARLALAPDLPNTGDAPKRLLPQAHMTAATSVAAGTRRAVWLEYDYDRDEMRCMKATWAGGGLVQGELLAPVPELPVRPAECRALAFDEAAGRLCLGLYSGVTVVLDYAPLR